MGTGQTLYQGVTIHNRDEANVILCHFVTAPKQLPAAATCIKRMPCTQRKND